MSDRSSADASLLLAAFELAHALIRRLDGGILYWSQGAERLYGWTKEEASGRTADELLETQYPLPKEMIVAKLLTEGHWEGELRHCKKDNKHVWVASQWVLGLDELGRPATVTEVNNDITALKDANERLEESEARFRQFAEAMPGMVWIVDLEKKGEFFNSFFIQYTGMTDFCGHWAEIVHPEDQTERMERWRQAIAQGAPYQAEYRLRRFDGVFRWHLARAVPMRNADGQIVKWFGALVDIDDQKGAAELLQQQTRELVRSNTDLQQFAAVASHDLQEPLRAVTSFANLLEERAGDQLDTNSKELLGLIQDGAERMHHLVADLLAYAKVDGDTIETPLMDVRTALDEAMANLRSSIQEQGAEISATPLPWVRANSTQLTQLFQNLLGNSLKYKGPQAPRIEVRCERREAFWHFQIKDNGIGFRLADAERIFSLFRRLHGREYPGTGMGLALCRRIVERHGGRIWAEGAPGNGATFFFTLPAEAAD